MRSSIKIVTAGNIFLKGELTFCIMQNKKRVIIMVAIVISVILITLFVYKSSMKSLPTPQGESFGFLDQYDQYLEIPSQKGQYIVSNYDNSVGILIVNSYGKEQTLASITNLNDIYGNPSHYRVSVHGFFENKLLVSARNEFEDNPLVLIDISTKEIIVIEPTLKEGEFFTGLEFVNNNSYRYRKWRKSSAVEEQRCHETADEGEGYASIHPEACFRVQLGDVQVDLAEVI